MLWQPEDQPPLDDADEIEVLVVIDEVEHRETFAPGDALSLDALDAAPTGATVRVEVATTGATPGLARSSAHRLDPGGGPLVETVVLAATDRLSSLVTAAPDAPADAALCGLPDGRVFAIGGGDGAALSGDSEVLDPEARAVVSGPGGFLARRDPACAVHPEGGVWLLGGCDPSGAPVRRLERADIDGDGAAFAEDGPDYAAFNPGCGVEALAVEEGVWLSLGIGADLISPSGELLARVPYPSARWAPTLVALGDDLLVVGGVDDLDGGSPVPGALRIAADSDAADSVPGLDGAVVGPGAGGKGAAGLVGAEIVGVDDDGPSEVLVVDEDIAFPGGFVAASLAPLPGGRFALLGSLGETLLMVGAGGTVAFDVTPPRPGARMLSDRGGALRIVGGGVAGTLVFVAPPL